MADDDIVGRIHQESQKAHELERSTAITEICLWRDAAYALLGDLRRNLNIFIANSSHMLHPLHIRSFSETGRGRKRVQIANHNPVIGWELRTWESSDDHTERTIRHCDYLLHDGRLFSCVISGVDRKPAPGALAADRAFLEVLMHPSPTALPDSKLPLRTVTLLYRGSKLPEPELPPAPSCYGKVFEHLTHDEWVNLLRQALG